MVWNWHVSRHISRFLRCSCPPLHQMSSKLTDKAGLLAVFSKEERLGAIQVNSAEISDSVVPSNVGASPFVRSGSRIQMQLVRTQKCINTYIFCSFRIFTPWSYRAFTSAKPRCQINAADSLRPEDLPLLLLLLTSTNFSNPFLRQQWN